MGSAYPPPRMHFLHHINVHAATLHLHLVTAVRLNLPHTFINSAFSMLSWAWGQAPVQGPVGHDLLGGHPAHQAQ